jgi:hypothetical protein
MPMIGPERVEAARRLARALARGMVAEGEAPMELRLKPIHEVVNDVEAWFVANEATLAEASVDLGFLFADRLLGRGVSTEELEALLGTAQDEDLVRMQEARVSDLEARLDASRQARLALWEALGTGFQVALGFALQAVLPRH